MAYHLNNIDKLSSIVVLVGNPDRAKLIASLLTKREIINQSRGLISYGGVYAGKKITVQTTGIGCPSAAIVIQELLESKAKYFIRFGSCCSFRKQESSFFLVENVLAKDGVTANFSPKEKIFFADKSLNKRTMQLAKEETFPLKKIKLVTVDLFYNPFIVRDVKKWQKIGIEAVDMETSAIFYLAQKHQKKAMSLLVKSDFFDLEEDFFKHEIVDQKKFNQDIIKAAKFILNIACRISD